MASTNKDSCDPQPRGRSSLAREGKLSTIHKPVHTWRAWEEGQPSRRYVVLTMPFGTFLKWFFIQPYDDRKDRKGWQRKLTESHRKFLRGQMKAGKYSPTCFYGGLLPQHERMLTFSVEGRSEDDAAVDTEYVTLTLSKDGPKIPCTDGSHRRGAIEAEYEAAIKAGDARLQAIIEAAPITLMLMLDSQHLQTDFLHYQEGKRMDRNTMKGMRLENRDIAPDRLPHALMADEVCHLLDDDRRSHLHQLIKFDSGSGHINYETISTWGGSDLGNSVYGGVLIAQGGGKDAKWLAETYIEVWQGLQAHAPVAAGQTVPEILMPGMMLTPYLKYKDGSKGASHFLIGLGNLVAWRKLFFGRDRLAEEALGLLATIAHANCLRPCGWSGTDKRQELRKFAAAYFADVVLRIDETPSTRKVGGYAGVPIPLANTLSPGSFAIDRKYLPKKPAARPQAAAPHPHPAPAPAPDRRRAATA